MAATVANVMAGKMTDKNTDHSYADVYEEYFGPIKKSAKNILEIGIYKGGSILTWYEYFTNADIIGVDVNPTLVATAFPNEDNRVTLVYKNAYSEKTVEFLSHRRYDVIIDDGPHSLESMIFFVKNYTNLLSDEGIIIVEDIQSPEWIPTIIDAFPEEYRSRVSVIDLRQYKNRYDDILIIMKK